MIIAEFMQDNSVHLSCDSGMASIITYKYPDEPIHLFYGEGHFNAIKNELTKHNIDTSRLVFHKIKPVARIIRDYEAFSSQLAAIKEVFSFAKANNENKILFTYTTMYSAFILKFFCLMNPKIKVQSVIHAELEKIDMKEYLSNTRLNKFQVYLYVTLFGIQNPLKLPTPSNLKYIVYGQSIKENALKMIPSLKDKLISIPHPYLWDSIQNETNVDNKIGLGIIGRCHAFKTIPILKKLCEDLKSRSDKNFELLFSGYIDDEQFYDYLNSLDFVYKDGLSRTRTPDEVRNKIINKMTYALFTYNLGSYKYTASGAVMDALNFEKPIIALSNDYIKSYFDKYGNIGYLCNSYEELLEKVSSVINNFPKEEYELQKTNLKKIKQTDSIENLAAELGIN